MTERAWKRTERKVAELLGGERGPVNGRIRGSAPDIAHDTLSLEVKSRKSIPAWLLQAQEQATASTTVNGSGKLPVAVLHAANRRYSDALVVVSLGDFAEFVQANSNTEKKSQRSL